MKRALAVAILVIMAASFLNMVPVNADYVVKFWGNMDEYYGFSNETDIWMWDNQTDTNVTLITSWDMGDRSNASGDPTGGSAQTNEGILYAWGNFDVIYLWSMNGDDEASVTEVVSKDQDDIIFDHGLTEPSYLVTYATVEIVNATITDLECGDWVFEGRTQYTFKATFYSELGGEEISGGIGFYDDSGRFYSIYTNTDSNLSTLTSPDDGISAVKTDVTVSGNYSTFTWHISFNPTVQDSYDVDLWCSTTDGSVESEWVLTSSDVFNIYNLGDYIQTTVTGSGSIITGGGAWELKAPASSTIRVDRYWANLQHLHTLFYMSMPSEQLPVRNAVQWVAFGIDWWYDGAWMDGLSVRIYPYLGIVNANNDWIAYYVVWFYNGTQLDSDYTIGFWEAGNVSQTDVAMEINATRIWLDLWFDTENATTRVGGRTNPYYYGMYKNLGWFPVITQFWATWSPAMSNQTISTFYHDMNTSSGDKIYPSDLKLMRAWCEVSRQSASPAYNFIAQNFDELNFQTAEIMRGIDTPPLNPTIVLDMKPGGLFAGVIAAIGNLLKRIGEALWTGALASWTWFVSFLDTLAARLGYPGFFSTILGYINSFYTWMTQFATWAVTYITEIYSFASVFLGRYLYVVTQVVAQWVAMINIAVDLFGSTYTSGIHVWNDLGGNYWVILGAILYPVYLLGLWETKGGDAVINQIRFLMEGVQFFFHIFFTIIQFVINLIIGFIESIPIIE